MRRRKKFFNHHDDYIVDPRFKKIVTVVGKLSVNVKGFGFVTPDEGGKDIFVAAEDLNGAFNGDSVKVRITAQYNSRREGRVIEILERANEKIVGTLTRLGKKKIAVKPDDKRITEEIVLPNYREKFAAKTKVVVKIISWNPLRGQVIETLGKENSPGVDILGILRSHGVEDNFQDDVQAEALRVEVEPSIEEISKRIDRRNLKVVTIDGEDAKDLDDGVFAEEIADGFFLGVYIADVSYYVRPHSALDREAFSRGTSIYPVDRVVPMLPKELSNGICSLNAGVDRLAMACEMKLNTAGEVVDYKIFPTVIHVHRRLSYTQVDKFLTGDKILYDCADNLNTLRKIRELRKKIPSLYRVHKLSTPEKILAFNQLLAQFNLHLATSEGRELEPRDFQKVLSKVKGLSAERIITTCALRTMQQAHYSPENSGHFGLAAEFYTHFTSPIRRYPDLIVHRMLRASFESPQKIPKLAKNLEEIANHSSERERLAVDVERETTDLKAVEYMQRFIGQHFDGVIDGVTNFGFFVELDNGVDGLVRAAEIGGDYYEFIERELSLVGQSTGKTFRIGDSVRVKLISANLKLRQLTFQFLSDVANKDLIAQV